MRGRSPNENGEVKKCVVDFRHNLCCANTRRSVESRANGRITRDCEEFAPSLLSYNRLGVLTRAVQVEQSKTPLRLEVEVGGFLVQLKN